MKILFCNYEYPPLGGGGGVVNALLAEELAKRHDVTVLTSQGLGLPQSEVQGGVNIIRVPVFFRRKAAAANMLSMLMFLPMGIWEGKKLVERERFDIVNTHFVLPSGPVGDAIARHAGIPNVLSLHGGDLYDPSKATSPHRHVILRMWINSLLGRAAKVVGQSTNTIENVHRFYDKKISPMRIPLGIAKPQFEPCARKDFGWSDGDVLLITVGRIVARKGMDQLITLMKDFKGEAVRLIIVGSGPQEASLKSLAIQYKVEHQIHFMGAVSEQDKFRLLQMSDLYVSTSQHEGFGLVFLEAMACGLPIICYDHGGQTDFLHDGEHGYLVPLNVLESFKGKCRDLVKNPEVRYIMGAKNKEDAEHYFIDQCARQYEEVFQSLTLH